jgi:hypothetical protein
MSSSASSATYDHSVLQLLLGSSPSTVAEVISRMEAVDQLLAGNDGLKWFNLLYLTVTREVERQTAAGIWQDPAWIARLDVIFAGFYFQALAGWLQGATDVPASWRALLNARFAPDVDRIQFALAGMNAHINHDLALALLQTDTEMQVVSRIGSPQHGDYERVNELLETVMPEDLEMLATGILGQMAQDTGKIGRLLGIWNVSAARDLAWGFAEHLRAIPSLNRAVALVAQDQMTGVVGRTLLLPIDPLPNARRV